MFPALKAKRPVWLSQLASCSSSRASASRASNVWETFKNFFRVGAWLASIMERIDNFLLAWKASKERKERQDDIIEKARHAADHVTSVDDLHPEDFRD